MNIMNFVARLAISIFVTIGSLGSQAMAESIPKILWASDPVLPDETVLLMGGGFTPNSLVQLSRVSDVKNTAGSIVQEEQWIDIKPLQTSDQSIKFVVPRDWKPGVFVCRVLCDDKASETVLINPPETWWTQGNHGETASPGGWFRVFGKCLSFQGYAGITDAPQSEVILTDQNGKRTALNPKEATCYALRFGLPGDLAAGEYRVSVHNGFGGKATGREAGTLRIAALKAWPKDVFNAKELGFDAALKKAEANGGGIIYFPRGRYEMKGQIKLPDYTVLKGAGMALASIYWADMQEPPDRLIMGKAFGIEDINIYCQGYYKNIIEDSSESNGVFLRRVRIRADAYWRLGGPGTEVRNGRTPVSSIEKLGDAIHFHGRNFEISDCDILSTKKGIILWMASNGMIVHNKIRYGYNGIGMEGVKNIICEDNDITGGDMAATGNFVSTYFSNCMENIYYAKNRFSHAYGWDQEFLSFDGSGGTYYGKSAKVEGTQMVLAEDPIERTYTTQGEPRCPVPDSWKGAAVAILDGKGSLQSRQVVKHDGRNWELDRPWDITPDDTSIVTISPYRGKVLFIGNTMQDGGNVQVFGASYDTIFAENRTYRSAGFSILWGHNGHDWGYQPSWRVQSLDNQIIEGIEWGAQTAAIRTNTGRENDLRYTGPLSRGAVMRRNIIHNHGRFEISGITSDVVVEHCAIRESDRGMDIGKDVRLAVLRANTFDKVDQPLSGAGLPHTLVVPAP